MAAPIYPKIKKLILEEIQDKPVNTPISSERELAAYYQASRMTVRNAVTELVMEGYLYRDKNKGTFVADQKLIKKNTSTQAWNDDDDSDSTIIYFSVKDADKEIAPHLNLMPEDQIIRIVRVNRKNKNPQSVEEIYYVRCMMSDEDVNQLQRLLDLKRFIGEGSILQRFLPITVPVKYLNFLKLRLNTPMIMVESTITGKDGTPVIYIREYNHPSEKVIEIIS